MKLLIALIGMVLILEGLPYATFPEKMQNWLRQMIQLPPAMLRMVGLAAVVGGLFLCYLSQRGDFFQ